MYLSMSMSASSSPLCACNQQSVTSRPSRMPEVQAASSLFWYMDAKHVLSASLTLLSGRLFNIFKFS